MNRRREWTPKDVYKETLDGYSYRWGRLWVPQKRTPQDVYEETMDGYSRRWGAFWVSVNAWGLDNELLSSVGRPVYGGIEQADIERLQAWFEARMAGPKAYARWRQQHIVPIEAKIARDGKLRTYPGLSKGIITWG